MKPGDLIQLKGGNSLATVNVYIGKEPTYQPGQSVPKELPDGTVAEVVTILPTKSQMVIWFPTLSVYGYTNDGYGTNSWFDIIKQ